MSRRRATLAAGTALGLLMAAPAPAADADGPCPMRLAPGQSCTAQVEAAQWQSPTGLQVAPGELYCVQVPPGQVWHDLGRRNTPPHGEPGNWLMRLFSGLKRHAGSDWFSLMAAVVPQAGADGPPAPPGAQDLGRQPLLRIGQAGALVLYPNDAVGPPWAPRWFYDNNTGRIRVGVQRCDGDCACPAAPPA